MWGTNQSLGRGRIHSEVGSKAPVLSLHSWERGREVTSQQSNLDWRGPLEVISSKSLLKAGSTSKFNQVAKGFVKFFSGYICIGFNYLPHCILFPH